MVGLNSLTPPERKAIRQANGHFEIQTANGVAHFTTKGERLHPGAGWILLRQLGG